MAAAVTARDAAGVGEELLSRLADHPEDDVAVVVVRVPSPLDTSARTRSPRRRRWSLPSEAASIGRARHAVVRTCQAWGIEDAANAELVVSELVANAVLHGFGHVSLQLYDTGDGLRIEVEDANPAPPVTTDGHPGRRRGLRHADRGAAGGGAGASGRQLVWARCDQLYDTGDGLRIEVEDGNPARRSPRTGTPAAWAGSACRSSSGWPDWGWRQSRGGKLVWAKVRPGSLPSHTR